MTLLQIHSVPAHAYPGCAETVASPPHPSLRRYVAGYGGFRAHADSHLRRRLLPINGTTLIIDFGGTASWVTGPRHSSAVHTMADWRHGVAIGLTPAGATALLGVAVAELVGATLAAEAILGSRATELAERLAQAPDWRSRFAMLDGRLSGWLSPAPHADQIALRAWWRLQDPAARLTVGELARELAVSRRRLELGFQRQIGLPPKTVARIARFQHAMHGLSRPTARLAQAADFGYADQAHFNREVRAMASLTPTELFAFVQDIDRATA